MLEGTYTRQEFTLFYKNNINDPNVYYHYSFINPDVPINFQRDNFEVLLNLCNQEKNPENIKKFFKLLSKEFRCVLALSLHTFHIALIEQHLPPEIIDKLMQHLLGEQVANLFLRDGLLVTEVKEERLSKLRINQLEGLLSKYTLAGTFWMKTANGEKREFDSETLEKVTNIIRECKRDATKSYTQAVEEVRPLLKR